MIYIYSIQFNKPLFIELQKKSFDKFIKNYKFTVIDNSIEPTISNEIKNICAINNINLIETVDKFDTRINKLHGFSHLAGVNCFLNELKNKHSSDDIVMVLDHDVFLISDFLKIFDVINESSILTITQQREHVYYVWPGLTIFNLKKCPNINEICLDGARLINNTWIPLDGVFTDVGGHSFHYLKKYENEIKFVDLRKYFVGNFDIIDENHIFYHFYDGSQWSEYSNEIWNNKFEKIKNFLT